MTLVELVLRNTCAFRSNILHFRSYRNFSIWAFFCKGFFVFTRLQLGTTSEFLTFRYAIPLQSEKESSHAKLLPSLEIGSKNTFLLPFGIILAQTRASN
jgi:hypothetical protein